MDYLDYELQLHNERIDSYCDSCGEYQEEGWQCDCEEEE